MSCNGSDKEHQSNNQISPLGGTAFMPSQQGLNLCLERKIMKMILATTFMLSFLSLQPSTGHQVLYVILLQ